MITCFEQEFPVGGIAGYVYKLVHGLIGWFLV
jgi:hypothetical protein